MNIEYYAFALFIAALICLIAILFKLLFSNVRRQNKLLDEKEARLLQLYRSVESIMEEFNEQIKTAIDDIKDHERLAAARISSLAIPPPPPPKEPVRKEPAERKALPDRPGKAMTVDSTRIRAASEVLERAERMVKSKPREASQTVANGGQVIQRLFDDTADEQRIAGTDVQAKSKRRESILTLAGEGKTHAQIARELGITQNEVKLVIGLNGST